MTTSQVAMFLHGQKDVEEQRAEEDAINRITEHKEFDKIKVSRPMYKESPVSQGQLSNPVWQAYRYSGSFHQPRPSLAYGRVCTECNKTVHFYRVCRSKMSGAVHEVEQEIIDNKVSEYIKMMSVH